MQHTAFISKRNVWILYKVQADYITLALADGKAARLFLHQTTVIDGADNLCLIFFTSDLFTASLFFPQIQYNRHSHEYMLLLWDNSCWLCQSFTSHKMTLLFSDIVLLTVTVVASNIQQNEGKPIPLWNRFPTDVTMLEFICNALICLFSYTQYNT